MHLKDYSETTCDVLLETAMLLKCTSKEQSISPTTAFE